MTKLFIVFAIATTNLVVFYDAVLIKDVDWCHSPYCKLPRNHTICKWGLRCPPDRRCQSSVDFNKKMKDYMMELHNKKRNVIALGEEQKVPKNARKASDMNVLQWDVHLEYVARCHSRQCDPKHDDCRSVPRFAKVGQNIYNVRFESEAKEIDVKGVIENAMQAWYNQVEHVPEGIYKEWDKTEEPTDNFTQMVWAKTTHIGCGLSEKHTHGLQYFLVCNYGNEGNLKGNPIYTVGEPCTKCPKEKTCNSKYKGLCGTIEEYALKCPCEE